MTVSNAREEARVWLGGSIEFEVAGLQDLEDRRRVVFLRDGLQLGFIAGAVALDHILE